ncbi:HAD family hydrolase [Devosia sp.]|uniref:HAD family hydrolase n=1 Tax=Devosia sp. TaxID=1871048 RepID=UPI002FC93319
MSNPEAPSDRDLADRHRPVLRFDRREPYLPVRIGYTVFREPGQSPSSKFAVEPRGGVTIEYAIYYDWDIGHLYDLEHVWVHLDAHGAVAVVEASAHGRREPMMRKAGLPLMEGVRPILFAEPGKHAHWADPEAMRTEAGERLRACCDGLAGHEAVHRGNLFHEAGAYSALPHQDRLARLKMQGDRFEPSFEFSTPDTDAALVPWDDLAQFVPQRVASVMAALESDIAHLKAIFLDCGDTLVDEGTEIKRPGTDVVLTAELLEGASATLAALRAAGHKLILVADGPRETFSNILGQHGLWDQFDAHVISEDVGELKPSAKMFDTALLQAGLTRADVRHVVMVGNNLERDIAGANGVGIASVFFSWSDRRSRVPAAPLQTPDYVITALAQLPGLLESIELAMPFRAPAYIDQAQQEA